MPAPYRRIACFIEESAASDLALEEALSVRAQSPGAELHVVHVAMRPHPLWVGMYGSSPPIGDYVSAADHWLGQRVADVPDAAAHLLEGWPPRVACQYAADAGIDLLVAAAHRGLVDRAMLGGFAAYVAYHAPCSVLLVHPPIAGGGGEGEGGRAATA
jgi:nucleotide-binding universal stress UspA family protein